MSTRGAYGFRKNDQDKLRYNHCDSYPCDGLGEQLMEYIETKTNDDLSAQFDFLEEVGESDHPTREQWRICEDSSVIDLNVGERTEEDWYCLIRQIQGDLSHQCPPDGIPYYVSSNDFLKDSLFCEWAYIINLDTMKFEIYKGYNTKRRGEGRYAKLFHKNEKDNTGDQFYGVVLIAEIPLDRVRELNSSDVTKGLENIGGNTDEEMANINIVKEFLV